jgi:RimJ/RimL family protein N-acetyltransferase
VRTLIRGELTVVRPATEGDVDMLVAWHADPEVERFWDWESYTPEQMRARLARGDVDPDVVEPRRADRVPADVAW